MAIGVILFLCGSNYYDAVIGWTGGFFVIIGFSALITLKVYGKLKKARVS